MLARPQYIQIPDLVSINSAILAHEAAADPHPQYLLANGTRQLSGNWNAGNFEISLNNKLSVKDSLGTDSIELSHNGIDGLLHFVNTGKLLIDGLTDTLHLDDNNAVGVGLLVTGGGTGGPLATFTRDIGNSGTISIAANLGRPQINFTSTVDSFAVGVDGNTFKIADSEFLGSGVRFLIASNGNIIFVPDTGAVYTFDEFLTDYKAEFHDGTDYNFVFVNTDTFNITGANLFLGTGNIRSYSDILVTNIDGIQGTLSTPRIQINADTSPNATISLIGWSLTSPVSGNIIMGKSRSATVGSQSIVADTDKLGSITFVGDDGVDLIWGAGIRVDVDGTPALGVMPTRMKFGTIENVYTLQITPSGIIEIYDVGGTDFSQLFHNGTNFVHNYVNTSAAQFTGANLFQFVPASSSGVRIYDSLGTDYIQFDNDGTDLNITLVNTTDLNIKISSTQNVLFGAVTSPNRWTNIDGFGRIKSRYSDNSLAQIFTFQNLGIASSNQGVRFVGNLSSDGVERSAFVIDFGSINATYTGGTDSDAYISWQIALDGALRNIFQMTGDTITVRTGGHFKLYDGTETDSVTFTHDGTDFNIEALNTTTINITNANIYTNGHLCIGNVENLTEKLTITDSGTAALNIRFDNVNTTTGFYVGIETSGDGIIYHGDNLPIKFFTSALERIRITGTGELQVRTGNTFTIFDSLNTDSGSLVHDGIDLNFNFVNTTAINISGASLNLLTALLIADDPGAAGEVLTSGGAGVAPSWSTAGDVVGPASSTDSRVALYNGTTGKLLKNSAFAIDGSGHVTSFGGNIAFPATQVASAGANVLDDYEEGTWTPSFTGYFTAPSGGTKRYRKIGDLCWFNISGMTDGTSNSTTKTVTLPFTAATTIQEGVGIGPVKDAATWQASPGRLDTQSASATANVYINQSTGSAWSNTGNSNFSLLGCYLTSG